MANITVTANTTTVQATVTAQSPPPIQVTAVSSQGPLMPVQVTLERRAVSVLVTGNNAPGTAAFTYAQTTPASEWSVPHPFGVRPASLQVLLNGVPIIPDVLEYSDIRVVLAFGDASTGTVTLLKGN